MAIRRKGNYTIIWNLEQWHSETFSIIVNPCLHFDQVHITQSIHVDLESCVENLGKNCTSKSPNQDLKKHSQWTSFNVVFQTDTFNNVFLLRILPGYTKWLPFCSHSSMHSFIPLGFIRRYCIKDKILDSWVQILTATTTRSVIMDKVLNPTVPVYLSENFDNINHPTSCNEE